ncbi:hypothetical protein KKC60_03040 [Patescibacteria group bacterium]|nr:hypothetical protein [Patescibacteria group bacterium]
MDNKSYKQKPIIHYLQEQEVPEELADKVLLAVTRMVYDRNQEAIKCQKVEDDVQRKEICQSMDESDRIIKETIQKIVKEKDDNHSCTDCLDF